MRDPAPAAGIRAIRRGFLTAAVAVAESEKAGGDKGLLVDMAQLWMTLARHCAQASRL
jgi:hypothetical protein